MKILTTASKISTELQRLLSECQSCEISVAWASIGFPLFDLLAEHAPKIGRMVVGTHFYQTHPDFIERFRENPNVRFVTNAEGVFHPKVYFFRKNDGQWECVVGSPNFTRGGTNLNAEVAVLISSEDADAQPAGVALTSQLDAFWTQASAISIEELSAYRESWKEKRPLLKNLQGKFGNPDEDGADDGGKPPSDIDLLKLNWIEYFQLVKAEENRGSFAHSMERRMEVIRAVQNIFFDNPTFADIDLLDRQRIAGMVQPTATGPNFLWFGSTGSGYFKQAVKHKAAELSSALDFIPRLGPVSRDAYLAFVKRFRQALPEKNFIASGTRLLAMKRPDYFVCLNERNKAELCARFKISRNVSFADYWDSIIERIQQARWWKENPPAPGIQRDVWEARTAFLDALSYDGKDMPSP
jgi:HKD family nuclease